MSAPPRRFYAHAAATPERGVTLDARQLRTPGGTVFVAPTEALAGAIAAEWNAQGEHIVPASMPLTQLAFAAIDWTATTREQIIAYVCAFIETDLVAHRAASPAQLVARQAELWDPLVAWARSARGVNLAIVTGLIAAPLNPGNSAALAAYATSLDDFRLTALAQAAGLAGSAVIALALEAGELDAEQAFQASALDALWSLDRWGDDEEARAKLDKQRAEFENIARFVALLSPNGPTRS